MTYNIIKILGLFCMCYLCVFKNVASAQESTNEKVKAYGSKDMLMKMVDSIGKTNQGKKFAMHGVYYDVYDKSIDFDHLEHPSFIFLGFYGCHPCETELPIFIELSAEYPDINFIYLTYNDKEDINKELGQILKKEFHPGENFYILSVDRAKIDEMKIASWGYPEKYYISFNGIINSFSFMGLNLSHDELKNNMKKMLAGN